MDLYAHDLGLKRYAALMRTRAAGFTGNAGTAVAAAVPVASPETARLGLLGRLWTRGSGARPAEAAAALSTMKSFIIGMIGGLGGGATGFLMPAAMMAAKGEVVGASVMGMAGLAMAGSGLAIPGVMFHRMHRKPLSAAEIETLLPLAHDDLERAFVTLALDAARQEVSPQVGRELRAAIGALAGAIDRLPAASVTAVDTEALRGEARDVLARAQNEPDRVIAASLERRAEALERRADASERSALLVRRAVALREELFAQTEALRAGLTAFHSGSTDTAGLAHLAETVRGVAAEAASVAEARDELDAFVPAPLSPAASAENLPPARLRVG